MSAYTAGSAPADELALDIDGVPFTLRVFPDPSGLRGQVFLGEEKIAGVQIFHTTDVERLMQLARTDRAVARAVERVKGHPDADA